MGAALESVVRKSTRSSTNPTGAVDSKAGCHSQSTEIESSHGQLFHQLQKSVSYALKYPSDLRYFNGQVPLKVQIKIRNT